MNPADVVWILFQNFFFSESFLFLHVIWASDKAFSYLYFSPQIGKLNQVKCSKQYANVKSQSHNEQYWLVKHFQRYDQQVKGWPTRKLRGPCQQANDLVHATTHLGKWISTLQLHSKLQPQGDTVCKTQSSKTVRSIDTSAEQNSTLFT